MIGTPKEHKANTTNTMYGFLGSLETHLLPNYIIFKNTDNMSDRYTEMPTIQQL